jgi:AcrR family transcriptional regulator
MAGDETSPSWEARALERSLGPARARSESQVHGLVEAARQLAAETGPGFTVQQVASKAGVSVKTLYRCFSGKDGLLLAVFEEDNRMAAGLLAEMMAPYESPVSRIRAFVSGLFELSLAQQDSSYIRLVMREYFRLAAEHSEQVEHVLNPYVDLLAGELALAAEAGIVQLHNLRRDATAIFLMAVSHLCPLVLADKESDSAQTAAYVTSICLRALGVAGEHAAA